MAQVAVRQTDFQTKLRKFLAIDDWESKLLLQAYNDIKRSTEKSSFVNEHMQKIYPAFHEHLEHGINALKQVDRPILVIGETSAGKSSFLNLLIGRTVLPEMTAPCTHCMCKITKGVKLTAQVSSFDGCKLGDKTIISGDDIDDEEFQYQLEMLVNEDNCDQAPNRCIDISVPSSILEDHVYLVDTPGFGENERLTKSLLKYLPEAFGIIFILNATVNLGIADDRGVLILDEIKRLRHEGRIPFFDPKTIVFIANKWDQVRVKERQSHLRKTIQKMKTVWPNFREDRLLPLSVTDVYAMKSGKHCSGDYTTALSDYQKVLDKIRETVESCAVGRSRKHKGFLNKVLRSMNKFLQATADKFPQQEKRKRIQDLKAKIALLEEKFEKGKRSIQGRVADVHCALINDICVYLNKDENRKEILPWKRSDIPRGKDYRDVKQKAYSVIHSFISDAISKRITVSKSVVDELSDEISQFDSEFKKIQEDIQELLKSAPTPDHCSVLRNLQTGQLINDEDDADDKFSKPAIAALVATSPLWVPVGLAGLLTVLPIGAAVEFAHEKYKYLQYKASPMDALDRWTGKILRKKYTKEQLEKIIFSRLDKDISRKLSEGERTITEFNLLVEHFEKTYPPDEVPPGHQEMKDTRDRLDETLTKLRSTI